MAQPKTAAPAPREPSREALLNTLKWLMSLPDPAPAANDRAQDR